MNSSLLLGSWVFSSLILAEVRLREISSDKAFGMKTGESVVLNGLFALITGILFNSRTVDVGGGGDGGVGSLNDRR